MKITETAVKVKQSHKFKEASFMVSQEDQSHLLHILRDQVYSDKVLAVIREYSTNAMDANIEAGNPDRPIEVKIPSTWDLFFSVRDFGPGLSFERIQNVFVKYGSSTKRNSNSEVGQLGIGAKSGFAYGHQFTIESYIDGTKTIYSAIIDESKRGKVVLLSESKTEEEDGTKIIIPVKSTDVQAFIRKSSSLYSWFKVAPKVKGIQESTWAALLSDLRGKPLVSGPGWEVMESGTSTVRMGCLPYPLSADALNITYGNPLYGMIHNQRILIDVPIGSVQITPSRESLSYDPATIKVITDMLKEVRKEMQKKIKAQIDDCKTLWEARNVAESFKDKATHSLVEGLVWKGHNVTSNLFRFKSEEASFKIIELGHSRYHHGFPRKIRNIICKDIPVFIQKDKAILVEDDMIDDSSRHESQRINPLLKGLTTPPDGFKTYVKVVLLKKGKDWDIGINKNGFDCPNIVKLSSLVRYKRDELKDYGGSSGSSGSYSPEKNKSKQLRFILDKNVVGLKRQDYFEVCDIDLNAGGVCVEVSSYNLKGCSNYCNTDSLHDYLRRFSKDFGVKLPEIIALKPKLFSEESVKDQWITLDEWFTTKAAGLIPAAFFQEILDLEDYIENNLSDAIPAILAKRVSPKITDPKSPFLAHVKRIGSRQRPVSKYSRDVLDVLCIPYGKIVESLRKNTTITSLLSHYPLLEIVETYPHSKADLKVKLISDYINMTDSTK
jgi:hypothetical protein